MNPEKRTSSLGQSRPPPLTIEKSTSLPTQKKWTRRRGEKKRTDPPPNTPSTGKEKLNLRRDSLLRSRTMEGESSGSALREDPLPSMRRQTRYIEKSGVEGATESSTIDIESGTGSTVDTEDNPRDMFETWRMKRLPAFDELESPSMSPTEAFSPGSVSTPSPTVSPPSLPTRTLTPALQAFLTPSQSFKKFVAEREAASARVPSLTWKVMVPTKASETLLNPTHLSPPSTPKFFGSRKPLPLSPVGSPTPSRSPGRSRFSHQLPEPSSVSEPEALTEVPPEPSEPEEAPELSVLSEEGAYPEPFDPGESADVSEPSSPSSSLSSPEGPPPPPPRPLFSEPSLSIPPSFFDFTGSPRGVDFPPELPVPPKPFVPLEDEGLPEPPKAPPPEIPKRTKRFRLRKTKKKLPLVGSFTWSDISASASNFLLDPANVVFVFWCIFVTVTTAALSLLEAGVLNPLIKNKAERGIAVQYCVHTINALFALMCCAWHPKFCRQSLQLWRWKEGDIQELRTCYSRDGTRKPNEWVHMALVVSCLHVACISTYAFATICWSLRVEDRPFWAVVSTSSIAWGALLLAFFHITSSPLGRSYKELEDYDRSAEEGAKDVKLQRGAQADGSFSLIQKAVENPEWQGSLIGGCCSNPKVAIATCLFPFCVFGINMERLGFGPSWVQSSTFALVLIGPSILFLVCTGALDAAELLPSGLVFAMGGILGFVGLLYGGLWRAHMRRAYRLPVSRWCCWSADSTDACKWLACSLCALCQEVRTTEHYSIDSGVFYEREKGAKGVEPKDYVEVEVEVLPEGGGWEGKGEGESPGPMDAPSAEEMV